MIVFGECTVPVKPPFLQVHLSDFYLIESFGPQITDLSLANHLTFVAYLPQKPNLAGANNRNLFTLTQISPSAIAALEGSIENFPRQTAVCSWKANS